LSRGPSTFRRQDVTRAIKAAFAAGATRARVEVGGIVITAEKSDAEAANLVNGAPNEWDAPSAPKGVQ
jgi:hypothetical protein